MPSSGMDVLQFIKCLRPTNIWGSYVSWDALRQESCHSLNLQKSWIIPTKDNSSVTSCKFCSIARTRSYEHLVSFSYTLGAHLATSGFLPKKLSFGEIFLADVAHFHSEKSCLTQNSLPTYGEFETTVYLFFTGAWLTLFSFLITSISFPGSN